MIQNDDGIAEINPDEYFNHIVRALRDAIDGNYELLIVEDKR